jgi:hypothetical protein
MQKRTIIKNIKRIIQEWGAFNSGEVESSMGETYSPCVNSMDSLVGLAEYFDYYTVEVNVYDTSSSSCDSIHDYKVIYADLPKDVLLEILDLCEQYDVIQYKTEKRISN